MSDLKKGIDIGIAIAQSVIQCNCLSTVELTEFMTKRLVPDLQANRDEVISWTEKRIRKEFKSGR